MKNLPKAQNAVILLRAELSKSNAPFPKQSLDHIQEWQDGLHIPAESEAVAAKKVADEQAAAAKAAAEAGIASQNGVSGTAATATTATAPMGSPAKGQEPTAAEQQSASKLQNSRQKLMERMRQRTKIDGMLNV